MSKVAIELNLGTQQSYNYKDQPYSSSALGLGPAMMQYNGGTNLTQVAYDTNDLNNTGSYIYYTPPSLGDNIKVQASLTQY